MRTVKTKVRSFSKWVTVCVLFFCLSVTVLAAGEGKSLYDIGADWDEGTITMLSSGNADKRVWYSFDNKNWMDAIYDGTAGSGTGQWRFDVTALSSKKTAKLYVYGDVSSAVTEAAIASSKKLAWKGVYAGTNVPDKGYVGGNVHMPVAGTEALEVRTYKEAKWVGVAADGKTENSQRVDVSKLEAFGGILYYRISGSISEINGIRTLNRPSLASSVKVPKAATAPKIKLNQTTGYLTGISTKMEVQILTGTNQSSVKDLMAVNSTVFEKSKTADGWYVFKGKAMDLAEIGAEGTIVLRVRVPATEKKPVSRTYELYQNMQAAAKPSYQVGEEIGSASVGVSYVNEKIMADKAGEYEYAVAPDSTNLQTTSVTWKTLTATNTSIASIKPSTSSSLYIRRKAVLSGSEYIRPSDKVRLPLNQRPALKAGKYSNYTLTIATDAVIEYTLDKMNWYEPMDVDETEFTTCSVASFRNMVTTSKAITLYYRVAASDTEQRLPSAVIKLTLAKLSKFQKFKIDGEDAYPTYLQQSWAKIAQYFPNLQKGVNKMFTGDYNTSPEKIDVGLVMVDSASYWGQARFSTSLGRYQYKMAVNGSPTNFNIAGTEGTFMHETMHLVMFMGTSTGMITADRFPGWVVEGMAQVAGGGRGWAYQVNTSSLSGFKSSLSSHLGKNTTIGKYGVGYYTNMYLGYLASDYDMDDLSSLSDAQLVTAMRTGLDRLFGAVITDGFSFQNAVKKFTLGKQAEFESADDFISQLKTTQLEPFYQFVLRLIEDMGDYGEGALTADSLSTPAEEIFAGGAKDTSLVMTYGGTGINSVKVGYVGGGMNKDRLLLSNSRNSVLYIGTPETVILSD